MTANRPIEEALDELLEDAYLGLYAQDPDTRAFIPMDDRHLVLHNDLKQSLTLLLRQEGDNAKAEAIDTTLQLMLFFLKKYDLQFIGRSARSGADAIKKDIEDLRNNLTNTQEGKDK
jgi:hypothetical protein